MNALRRSTAPNWLQRLSLRARLVAGFVCAIFVLLTVAGAFVYWRVEYAFDRALDTELAKATATIVPLVNAEGSVTSPDQADATGVGWQLLTADGSLIASGGRLAGHDPVPADDLTGAPRTVEVGSMLSISPDQVRLRVTPVRGKYLVVVVDRARRDEALRELLAQLVIAGGGTLLVASIVGDLLARGALRPVERYRARASDIAAGATKLRLEVPDHRDDEVTRLGHTLNEMLTSLDAAMEHERHFVSDASHELRTPVTVIAGRIDQARRKARTAAYYEHLLDELSIDAQRLVRLTESLLSLSGPVDDREGSSDVLAQVAATADAHLAAGNAALRITSPTEPVLADVSAAVLDRIVTNLVTNAVVHGAQPIEIHLDATPDLVILQVIDDGPGMTPDLLARATDRFARGEHARTRPGAGLGLALIAQLVTAAGGELRLCYTGDHASFGTSHDQLACTHDARMTVSVLLPRTQ
ncbi:sensor histidine kinase [Streptomyces mirabilis]|uniref:sensor histidine kinase n=1 Tax=Streptomyces mirabilis TaxID=68239 RepID=UPI0035D67A12